MEKMMTSVQNKGKFPSFHRTPVKAREILYNPSIEGVFGKLQAGLSAPVKKYYKKKDRCIIQKSSSLLAKET